MLRITGILTLVNIGAVLVGASNYTELDGSGRASTIFRTCEMGNQLHEAVSAFGPGLNTLIKLMSFVVLAIGPFTNHGSSGLSGITDLFM
jgi:hypothetical protein